MTVAGAAAAASMPVAVPAAAPATSAAQVTSPDSAATVTPATPEPHAALYDVEAAHDFDALAPQATAAASALGMGDDQEIADFFSVTDEQLKERDRDARRESRSQPGRRGGAGKMLIVIGVILVLVAGLLGGAYALGFGFPTQQQTVAALLAAHTAGDPVEAYWVAVTDKDIAKEMAKIPPLTSFALDGVTMRTNDSVVLVTVTPKTGAPLHYTMNLSREGVGWKVTGVENDWRSTGGS